MVFVGTKGAPETQCGNDNGTIPATTIDAAPLISEKPYIVAEGDKFKLMSPILENNKVGATKGYNYADAIDFKFVYVAKANDSAQIINDKISKPGMHLVL
jgi:hypothetical protein